MWNSECSVWCCWVSYDIVQMTIKKGLGTPLLISDNVFKIIFYCYCFYGKLYFITLPIPYNYVSECSSDIKFSVNGKAVDARANLSVGDVVSCSADGLTLSYRWTRWLNGKSSVADGEKVVISQPGSFNYQCTVFIDCNSRICPFSRNITGVAAGMFISRFLYRRNCMESTKCFTNRRVKQKIHYNKLYKLQAWMFARAH